MGAGPSIISGDDPLAVDYNTIRQQVWGDMNSTRDNQEEKHDKPRDKDSIRLLASRQLSSKIQSHRQQSKQGTPVAESSQNRMQSRSFHVPSSVHSPHASLDKDKSQSDRHLSPRSSNRVVSFDRAVKRADLLREMKHQMKDTSTSTSSSSSPEKKSQSKSSGLILTEPAKDEQREAPEISVTGEPKETPIPVRKKPNLAIQVLEATDSDAADYVVETSLSQRKPKGLPKLKLCSSSDVGDDMDSPKTGREDEKGSLMYRRMAKMLKIDSSEDIAKSDDKSDATETNQVSPGIVRVGSGSGHIHLSPGGSTAMVGHWRIKETGLQVSPRAGEGESGERIQDKGSDAYVEIGNLGSGASGTVVEALHVPTLTIVALKVLPVHNPKKNHFLSQELAVLYKNLANLRLVDKDRLKDILVRDQSTPRCRYVLSMYDAFIDTRACKINLVMEIMDGGSLQDLVESGGCRNERVLADIAYQVLRGLQYLHSQKQMHRDIKPGNILLNCQGWIKVADFGISKAMDNTFGCAKSFVGTMCYMAPERITANTYGFPADIWSMGLTLLAVSMGRFPLPDQAEGFWGLLHLICDSEPPTAGPEFSEDFNDFISRCLQKDPDLRGSPEQLLNHRFLSDFKSGHPRRSMFGESDSETHSRSSSVVSTDTETPTPLTQPPVTLAKLAATKDLTNDEDELYDIRFDHLVHIAEVLQRVATQRETSTHVMQESLLDGIIEDDSDSDFDGDSFKQPVVRLQPVRLPAVTGWSVSKWRHLAEQLHLPVDTVIEQITMRIDERFFLEPEMYDDT